jgi:2-keto-3-deoxy-L-rhamnonate aldolase RhmA
MGVKGVFIGCSNLAWSGVIPKKGTTMTMEKRIDSVNNLESEATREKKESIFLPILDDHKWSIYCLAFGSWTVFLPEQSFMSPATAAVGFVTIAWPLDD